MAELFIMGISTLWSIFFDLLLHPVRIFRHWISRLLWQEYTEELYKKDLHDPDNHNGVITDLQPDILECEVKWALERVITNKASGGMKFQLSYFKT